jgi:hypothetical protein
MGVQVLPEPPIRFVTRRWSLIVYQISDGFESHTDRQIEKWPHRPAGVDVMRTALAFKVPAGEVQLSNQCALMEDKPELFCRMSTT